MDFYDVISNDEREDAYAKEYQDKYNIIFKDYPDGFPNMWKKILNDIGAEKILYISNFQIFRKLNSEISIFETGYIRCPNSGTNIT